MFKHLTNALFAALLSATGLLATAAVAAASTPAASASTGFDISYPQCGATLPGGAGFAVVGVNDGHPFSANPCLAGEIRWSEGTQSDAPAFYMNTGSPGPAYSSSWPTSQQSPRICYGANSQVCAYDFGWNAAKVSFANAVAGESTDGSLTPETAAKQAHWWLDVETGNTWETIEPGYGPTAASDANDQQMLQGSIAYLSGIGVTSIGIYSTPSQWRTITGGTGPTFPAVPVWVPGFATLSAAQAGCTSPSFTGGRVAMIQYPSIGLDGDYVCGLLSSPAAGSVTVAGSSAFSDQLVVSGNSGTVTYAQTGGSPALTVASSGVVTTSGTLVPGSYTATGTTSDTTGDYGTFIFTLTVGTMVQTTPLASSVKSPGSSTFSDQLAVNGSDGAVNYVQTSGAPTLNVSATGLVTTGATLAAGTYAASGTTSDPNGDVGTFSFTLSVGAITQNAPLTGAVVTTNLSTFAVQLSVSHNDGAVTYTQSSGTPSLTVSPAGLLATSATLASSTYVARGTTTDAFGDKGTFVFILKVTPVVPAATFTATSPLHVLGYAIAGRSVTLAIAGAGFFGRPLVRSHPGTTALVTRDTGKVLIVRVSVEPGSRDGVYAFTVTLPNGVSRRVKYNQR